MMKTTKARLEYPCFRRFTDTTPGQEVLLAMAGLLLAFARKSLARNEEFSPMMQFAKAESIETFTVDVRQIFQSSMAEMKGEVLSGFLAYAKADFYVIATEAWSLSGNNNPENKERLRNYRHGDLERHPDRVSCLFLMGETIADDVFTVCWEIDERGGSRTVDWDNPQLVTLHNRADKGVIHAEGAMTNLLEERRAQLRGDATVH